MIFSYLKYYFIFFNVNEHLAVPFVELTRGQSRVGNFRLFCLPWSAELLGGPKSEGRPWHHPS